jgi:predicted MPP superfamily phosphohydrolase
VRLRTREVTVQEMPRELDGLRVAHLSDFHLGMPSRGVHAVERAVDWVAERRPDIVCITGDLLSRARGQPLLNDLLERLPSDPYVVLGNHDFALSRDPFSEPVQLGRLPRGTLLADRSLFVELRGVQVEIAGVDPRSWISYRTSRFEPSDAPLRILLCHFPRALDYVPAGRWQLILAGHLHGGQIVVPYGRRSRLLLAHPSSRYRQGIYTRGVTTMHVSPGLGTTFVPVRYFARPEATELVLRSG